MPIAVDPCELVKCRNVELSEESLRRHYDILLEIAKDFFKVITGNYVNEPRKLRSITELYDDVRISRKIGDKILDRLECCWKYIFCLRSTRGRRWWCMPTILGLYDLFKRPEYRKELLRHPVVTPDMFLKAKDLKEALELARLYETSKRYENYEVLAPFLSSFKNGNELGTAIVEVRGVIYNTEGLLKIIASFLVPMPGDVEDRLRAIERIPGFTDFINFARELLDTPLIHTVLDLYIAVGLIQISALIGSFISEILPYQKVFPYQKYYQKLLSEIAKEVPPEMAERLKEYLKEYLMRYSNDESAQTRQ